MQPNSRIQSRLATKRIHQTHWVRKIILGIITFIVVMFVLGAGLFFYYVSSAPRVTTAALSSDNSTKIYDRSGHLISKLGAQNRDYASNQQIPNQLKDAITSTEDRRFYKDHGVDPTRIIKAGIANFTGSRLGLQGGSTLTQQLVKLSVFSTAASDRTLKRKAQEAWLALKVDHNYPKSKILEYYINKVYMGNNAYGMKTAAHYYYGKSLKRLTLPELAMLAGMPQSPTLYDPYRYPKYAQNRRDQVLNAMARNHKITSNQAEQAKATPIKDHLSYNHHGAYKNAAHEKIIDAYLQQTIQELRAHKYRLHAGLKVYTNLNYADQKKLYNLANHSTQVKFPSNQFQIGAALVDAHNGKVNAMLGGRKIKAPFGLNRAVQTGRSSGSTIKPLMDYGPAIQNDYYPTYQVVHDTPFTYPGTDVQLKDYDKKYEGNITMRRALIESRNIPAIRTLQNVGIPTSLRFMKKLGITFHTKTTLQNGINAYVSPLQEAAAFAAFANNGIYHHPYTIRKVVEEDGNTRHFSSQGHRAMSKATAFMMNDMLKGVLNDSKGSGTAARIPGLNEAGKTGTTQYPADYKGSLPGYAAMDSWFTGYTPNAALSIWTGYDHPLENGHYVSGPEVNIAQDYYKYAMKFAQRNQPNTDWTQPNDVNSIRKDGRTEYYIAGHEGDVTAATNNSNRAKKMKTADTDKDDKDNDHSSRSNTNGEAKNHDTSGGSTNRGNTPDDNKRGNTSNSSNQSPSNKSTDSSSGSKAPITDDHSKQ